MKSLKKVKTGFEFLVEFREEINDSYVLFQNILSTVTVFFTKFFKVTFFYIHIDI